MQKLKLSLSPLILSLGFSIPLLVNAGNIENASVIKVLTSHQWTIVEYMETINDTAQNLTIDMLPCEKDNMLKFISDTSYVIFEGPIKCSATDPDVKGQGMWQYTEDKKIITDRYSGGAEFEKKILDLNDGLFKVQYAAEGKTITITYLSEAGKKDETKKDQYVDNSDPSSTITQMMREDIAGEQNCTLIGLNDFDKENASSSGGGVVKNVVVVPPADMTDPNKTVNVKERNNNLIQQGKKSGMDYIATGVILHISTQKGSDGKPNSQIKYTVHLLDVKKGKTTSKDFQYPEPEKGFHLPNTGLAPGLVNSAAKTAIAANALGKKSNSLAKLYVASFAAGTKTTNSYNSNVFSNANNDDRKQHFETSLSVYDAIGKTEPDLTKFLNKETK